MIVTGRVLPFPGATLVLAAPTTARPTDILTFLEPVLEPRTIAVELATFDQAGFEDNSRRIDLRTATGKNLEDGIPVAELPALDARAVAGWLAREERAGEAPTTLEILDARYRVAREVEAIDLMANGPTPIRIPGIDRWIDPAGATLPSEKPVTVLATERCGKLKLAVHWSPWIDRDSPIAKQLRDAVQAMTSTGWTITFRSEHWQ